MNSILMPECLQFSPHAALVSLMYPTGSISKCTVCITIPPGLHAYMQMLLKAGQLVWCQRGAHIVKLICDDAAMETADRQDGELRVYPTMFSTASYGLRCVSVRPKSHGCGSRGRRAASSMVRFVHGSDAR